MSERALSIAATGMLAQQLNVEVISNNIANMNTTAYKRQRADFEDLLYQTINLAGTDSSDTGTVVPSGIQLGTGVKAAAVYRITDQGDLLATGNALDVALQGRGYLQVELPNGETAYTRAGALQLSPTGVLVTADGYEMVPNISIPANATEITINGSGEVIVKTADAVAPVTQGQLLLATFLNEAGLQAAGDNLFKETIASGGAVTGTPGTSGFGTIIQGYVETSNVNTVSEITNLITAQRAYEMNAKVIETSDQMMTTVAQSI
ncbi:MAG: flagellar basal-body rod protein FlgG [Alphaproteobacteria bacterium]